MAASLCCDYEWTRSHQQTQSTPCLPNTGGAKDKWGAPGLLSQNRTCWLGCHVLWADCVSGMHRCSGARVTTSLFLARASHTRVIFQQGSCQYVHVMREWCKWGAEKHPAASRWCTQRTENLTGAGIQGTPHHFSHMQDPCVGDEAAIFLHSWMESKGTSHSPATSTMSPGTMSLALIIWTALRFMRYTFPISGSYSFKASMAFSAFLSWANRKGK